MQPLVKLHDTDSDERQLYPSSLRTLVCKCALEKEEVMGGTVHDTPLHERPGTAVADRTSLIIPDLLICP